LTATAPVFFALLDRRTLAILYEFFQMEKKVGQHPGILENIRQNIAVAEEKRRELRFIYTLNEFEQGNVRILHNDEFITGLEHLLLADHNENREKKIQLLGSLGQGALAEEPAVRERALAVLSSATQFHLAQNDHAVLSILAHCLCRWLEFWRASGSGP
jgi:hypothetical protein